MGDYDTYSGLTAPATSASYVAAFVTEYGYRVGRSFLGHPVIFLAFDRCSGARSTARRLATLRYDPPKLIEVRTTTGAPTTENLAILECRSDDEQVVRYFFRLARSILDAEARSDETLFDSALDTVVTIFRAQQRAGRRSVQGVWGELAIIAWAQDTMAALASWHSSPRAVHDFGAGVDRLEVKSSASGIREHNVRLEQLSAIAPGATIVASLMLEESESGASIADLIDLISGRISAAPEVISRLQVVVAESLGRDWRESTVLRYDVNAARDSLRLFDAGDVPRVALPAPPEVKDIRFVVDLTHVPDRAMDEVRALSAFFSALLPRGTGD
jgi:hypothetical protein